MSKWPRVEKGVSWRQVGEQGVVIHPRREIMVGLTGTGWRWWAALVSGRPEADGGPALDRFVDFFRRLGFFAGGPADAPDAPAPELPAEVSWLEPFRPLAFTASCGRVPAGGGPCTGNPHEGH